MSLLASLKQSFESLGFDKTYWIAYSGGMDSEVLLSLCVELAKVCPLRFNAIHINHGLSPNAGTWAAHCRARCMTDSITLVEHTLHFSAEKGESLEAACRKARYEAFAAYLREGDVLVTAHHQNDQAETLLLQLLRGAGLKGLAGMPHYKRFCKGGLFRPLLSFSQATLRAYAKSTQLNWIEDESNLNLKFSRNIIRHEILPKLETHWPEAVKTIARSASHCAEAQTQLDIFSQTLLARCTGTRPNTLSITQLGLLSEAQQRLILRAWMMQQGFLPPNTKKLNTIRTNVLHAAWDKMPCVEWNKTELRRYRDDLYLLQQKPACDYQGPRDWDFSTPLRISGVGEWVARRVQGQGLRGDLLGVTVRFRPEIKHLKQRFQVAGIPPWERTRIPLLFVADELVAIPDYFINKAYLATKDKEGWLISQLK